MACTSSNTATASDRAALQAARSSRYLVGAHFLRPSNAALSTGIHFPADCVHLPGFRTLCMHQAVL